MSNVLSEAKQQQVLALGRLGWSLRRIEQATGVRRETAGLYLRSAGVLVRAPRCRGPSPLASPPTSPPSNPASEVSTDPGAQNSNPASGVSTDSIDLALAAAGPDPVPARSPSASACEPWRDVIGLGVERGRNAMAIWQELVDDHGFTSKYASVRRYVVKLRGEPRPEAHCVIVTAPGEEAQVDYGEGPMVRHPKTGKYRRTRMFVLTLGYSRKSVRLLCWNSSSRAWAELHERAFRRLGGAARVVVLDNLREGVLEPDVFDAALNPLYRDMLAHYGATALPCRVRDPNRKGKVERAVGHAQDTPLKGLRFETLEEAQVYLDRWESRWADTRIHGTTKRQVAAMFAEEKPALLTLPIEPFRYYQYGTRVVHLDGAVEVEAAYYCPPPGWVGKTVHVQWNGVHVRILDPRSGALLREHLRAPRGWRRLKEEDRPARTPLKTQQLLVRAANAGQQIGVLCRLIHERRGEAGVRRILGVLSLAKKHGLARVEEACAAGLELGAADYRFVRRWIERHPAASMTLRQVDPLIRELTMYRDFINLKTGMTTP